MKNTETERKYLVSGSFEKDVKHKYRITQGYISDDPARTVRVRIRDDQGFLTIKGAPDSTGTTRFEWEKEISYVEAQQLTKLCKPGMIEKIRNIVEWKGFTFEVDVFKGDNEGLIVAEIELEDTNQVFDKPAWLDKEITGDRRFYNASLMSNPYKLWKSDFAQENKP